MWCVVQMVPNRATQHNIYKPASLIFKKRTTEFEETDWKIKNKKIGINGEFIDIIHAMYKIPKVHLLYENYRGWFGQPIVHFVKYQKTRQKIGQKARGCVKFYTAACFTSCFVSCFPNFQEMENAWPHETLCGCVLSYAAASSGSRKIILQNNFEPQKRGRVFYLVLEIHIFQITWIQTKI